MIKLVVFDLDGVLVDSKSMHYDALNAALADYDPMFVIPYDEHLAIYDGLSTTEKLGLLTERKGLPANAHHIIWKAKQQKTLEWLDVKLRSNPVLTKLFWNLKEDGFQIAVASNAMRHTVKVALVRLGLIEYVDFFYSNEDVRYTKPNTEIYLKCMIAANASPSETVILEDSHIGRKGAIASGAHLLPVDTPSDVTYDKIINFIKLNNKHTANTPWVDHYLNVLIPMAGAGSRFEQAGYTFPKPLIEVNGKPMIQTVVENLNIHANYTFIVQKSHYEKYNLNYLLNLLKPGCRIVQVDGLTEGAACTTLLAKEYINDGNPLVIANSDQYIDWNANECMYEFATSKCDAGILTFESTHPKWSYVKTDAYGHVTEVAEKKVISNQATVGVYYWKHGCDYVEYAERMIEKNIRVNNEFYVCPVFNEAILDDKKITTKQVKKMWGIGTPEDLQYFLMSHKDEANISQG